MLIARIVLLLFVSLRDIRLYADMAFIDNPEYYDTYYASEILRKARIQREGLQGVPASQHEPSPVV